MPELGPGRAGGREQSPELLWAEVHITPSGGESQDTLASPFSRQPGLSWKGPQSGRSEPGGAFLRSARATLLAPERGKAASHSVMNKTQSFLLCPLRPPLPSLESLENRLLPNVSIYPVMLHGVEYTVSL